MESKVSFRADLYRGTARYYDAYRPPYPEALLDDLCQRLPATGRGKLLDLACGTGQVALSLAARFAEVWAVDQEPEMVAFGQRKADSMGIANVRWVAGSAERVRLDVDGGFELVVVANAFHRLDREAVAARMASWLRPGGGVALVWADSPWRGEEAWQRAMAGLLREWISKPGMRGRVPAGWQEAVDRKPDDRVLEGAGLDLVGKFDFPVERIWTLESLAGFVYSTSFLNRLALGDRAAAYEQDLGAALRAVDSSGRYEEAATCSYVLARKPVSA